MYRKYVKRLLDLCFAILALPFFLIILLFVAPVIYMEDKGPIFYNAPRLGKNAKVFTMYKFRSMKTNAPDLRNPDGSTFNASDDSRMTKIGKFIRKTSIDETPQIFNVIKGEMSIVGPRPDLIEQMQYYINKEKDKLKIKPGITGYNQAFFRNIIPWKEKIANDIFYIDNCSFLFDLRIMLKTAVSVFRNDNIYLNKNGNHKINL
jgi:lipopolysaccharide/colanic/teichoic acid biosynthesis glycosyltransferase